jgi:hypothetical protein
MRVSVQRTLAVLADFVIDPYPIDAHARRYGHWNCSRHPCMVWPSTKQGVLMAKPNYSFAKRQREIAKKQKKDEKRAQKEMAKRAENPDQPDTPADPEAS